MQCHFREEGSGVTEMLSGITEYTKITMLLRLIVQNSRASVKGLAVKKCNLYTKSQNLTQERKRYGFHIHRRKTQTVLDSKRSWKTKQEIKDTIL